MKIAIDDCVDCDENGNYLVNIGYLRVSTDRQADLGFGLDIQEADIVRYSRANGYKNLVLFIDDGYTGTNMERPALKAITDAISNFNAGRTKIRVNSLVVARIDRLGRTLLGTLQFIQDYIVSQNDSKNSTVNHNKEDINFVSVAENYCRIDKSNPQGKFLLMLFATLAEFDRDLIVEKLKRGRTARVASGKWIGGGNTPYGYRYDRKAATLVVVPEEAAVVKEIFRLYIEEKMPPQKIADRFGFSSDRAITQILRRKSLTGCIVYNGQEYQGLHEAIIPLEVWQEAQEELERRSSHRTSSDHLLSGLVYCGECGAKMRYIKWGARGHKFMCYSQQTSKKHLIHDENCDNERFWADDVEKAVIDELFRLKYLGQADNRKADAAIDPAVVLQKELTSERRRLSRLYDFEDEDETDDILREKIFECKKRILHIEAQIRDEESKAAINRRVDKARHILRSLQSTWPHMTALEHQSVCRELIDKVVIYKSGRIDVHLKLKNYLQNGQTA
jgi:site-specific DNA recombinase